MAPARPMPTPPATSAMLPEDQPHDVPAAGAQCHPHADLLWVPVLERSARAAKGTSRATSLVM